VRLRWPYRVLEPLRSEAGAERREEGEEDRLHDGSNLPDLVATSSESASLA
jgi:hypothetical protein